MQQKIEYESPAAITNYFHLLLTCAFYIVLTWYFDRTLESVLLLGYFIFLESGKVRLVHALFHQDLQTKKNEIHPTSAP
jgi:hypothetical protein